MTKNNIYVDSELSKDLNIPEEMILNIKKFKLIIPVGVTKDKVPFYSEENRSQFIYIKSMFDLGYSIEEVQKIIKKVGFPKALEKGNEKVIGSLLTVGDLAAKAGVSIRTIKHWEEKGIIESDMRSDGGFRLFSESYIYLCKLILDLQLFGYTLNQIKVISDHFREFLLISNDLELYPKELTSEKIENMNSEISDLKTKIKLLKEGINRWEDLLAKKIKDLNSVKKKNIKRQAVKQAAENDIS